MGTLTALTVNATDLNASGTTSLNEVIEKVTSSTSTTGTIDFDCLTQAIQNYTADQTGNRTINFRGDASTTLNDVMSNDESMTFTLIMKQGATPQYLNAYQVDGVAVTVNWSGGDAPTAGNASGLDVYTFTIIKTDVDTFTVLASLTQYA